jgi:hypothetical protein
VSVITEQVMITLTQSSQAGTSHVRAAWLRWQSQVSGLYYRRVTEPVQLWRAVGRLPEFRPQLPWWQPFVWRYLVLTGWRPSRPSRRHRV